MNSIPEKIREAVTDELERRLEEAETYLEITQEQRADTVTEFAAVIDGAIRKQIADAEPGDVARRAAGAAADVVESAFSGLRRRSIERAVAAAVEQTVRGRLDHAAKYLRLLECQRALAEHELPWMLTELFRERLDACEDFVPLLEVDWSRVRAIVLPERAEKNGAFRRYSSEALATWSKLCRTVLPEGYCDPATASRQTTALPGTWEKVDVMAARLELGLTLTNPADAVLAEDAGMVAPQSLASGDNYKGNGKKDARMIDGVCVDKDVVSLRGHEFRPPTPEEEWGSADWWKLRPRTGDVPPPLPTIATVDVLPDHPDEVSESAASQPIATGAGRKKKVKDMGPALPFGEVA